MLRTVTGVAFVVLSALSLAACAGTSSTLPPGSFAAPDWERPAASNVTVRITIAAPHRTAVRSGLSPEYFSRSSEGVLIAVFPHGRHRTAPHRIARAAFDISPGSNACGGKIGYPRTCAVVVAVPATKRDGDDFIVTDYDAKPIAGAIPRHAHLLGRGAVVNHDVIEGAANDLTVYLGGVISSLSGNPSFVSLPANGHKHSLAIAIDPEDFDNNPITAGKLDHFAHPIIVSVAERGGSGHALLSLDGAPGIRRVKIQRSDESVELKYDGGGSVGYGATVKLAARPVRGSGGALEAIDVGPLELASDDAQYAAPVLALSGNGNYVKMSVGERGAPPSTVFTMTPLRCGAIALAQNFTQTSASSASFTVLGRAVVSTPAPGKGCTIAVSDGTSTVGVAVTNRYTGVLGTPAITEFTIPTSHATAKVMTVGPDGEMWFSECGASKVAKMPATAASPTIVEYSLPASLGTITPEGIGNGVDANVWWADCGGSSTIGKMTTAGVGTPYATQSHSTFPKNVSDGPDGAMWFTECGAAEIGRASPGGTLTYYSVPTAASEPWGITLGSDGNLWFTEWQGHNVGKITTGGQVTEFTLAAGTKPFGITAGPDGALWFVELGGNKIGRIPTTATTSAPQITEYSLLTAGANPQYITVGPDGALWFTETNVNKIGRLDPKSAVNGTSDGMTEYTVPTTSSFPYGIAAGPDGAVWFTESYFTANKVGRIAIATSKP